MVKLKLSRRILTKIKKAEKEKAKAEEVRKQAMERMADTKKRENDESDSGNENKKVRRSSSDTIDYLKEKSAKDHDLKKKELELRKRELKVRSNMARLCLVSRCLNHTTAKQWLSENHDIYLENHSVVKFS